jgi:ribosome-binding protein aMBF1 (putative translation factor)
VPCGTGPWRSASTLTTCPPEEPRRSASGLRRLREERGLSQRELAEPGVSYAYLSRLEVGQRVPSEKTLRKIAAKLGVTPLYLEVGRDDATCPHCGAGTLAAF